ncbi:hypothetical protein M406DRAFT_260292 [Cryphonectria parasitica EP155]|uniref:Uncharacterized protein n=1 Tax=Cryphonectria parasitica (strain ATCC 38755 / EP155) TaxID=660469 RepID=A0A9P5CNA1_CRYP1|nr:uncharacterized protein M406DRAFT_260292 [Cryphonectria parasitica EP155]KAF3764102.1 hypothetical protein M406DRAFT_260292 [Cryphonectria parasitica EP155]
MLAFKFLTGALAVGSSVSALTGVNTTGYIDQMFSTSMSFLDEIYDPVVGYLWYFYFPLAAGKHETRSTVWYAAGLLRRNQGNDVNEAVRIIESVIGDQQKNVSDQWYGDYTKYPEEPTVGTAWYPESIYNSWDPNWRGFIGTTLVVIYEEYGSLLPASTRSLILESMRNNTIGDSYRVGGVDGDNLYPAYSNPALMRAATSGWTGRKLNDSNLTSAGEAYAQEVIDLFDLNNTLSEFNSATYCGVSLFALTLWAKYLPESSVMGANGARMIKDIWTTVGELYNANLRNIAGPWDRTYGWDQNLYVGIMNAYIWSLVGEDKAPGINTISHGDTPYWAITHADDFEIAPLLSAILPYHHTLVPDEVRQKLLTFPGEHTYKTAAYAPPYDLARRNITTWLSDNITIGAESFDQTVVGGFSINPSQWAPSVVQWLREDGSVGWFSLYGTEEALDVDVQPGSLGLTYPYGNNSATFTFLVASNPYGEKRDILGWEDVMGLSVNVSGTVDLTPEISFCGLLGGTCEVINDWEFWNFTYVMPEGSTETPSIVLDITVL